MVICLDALSCLNDLWPSALDDVAFIKNAIVLHLLSQNVHVFFQYIIKCYNDIMVLKLCAQGGRFKNWFNILQGIQDVIRYEVFDFKCPMSCQSGHANY
jgi:hypothetical protein